MPAFFLDTYAMVEYLRGNQNYHKYFSSTTLTTSVLNLIELYFMVLREYGEEIADNAYGAFRQYQAEISEEDIKQGMKLRLRMKLNKTALSYADALGYVMAERLGVKYLTGDTAFKTLPNVEFIK